MIFSGISIFIITKCSQTQKFLDSPVFWDKKIMNGIYNFFHKFYLTVYVLLNILQ